MAQCGLRLLAARLLRNNDLIMKKYEIIGHFIQLHGGVVQVTASQAKRRSAMLAPIGGDLYRIDNPVQFKVGEIIGIDYEPPKSLIEFMKLVEELPVPVEVIEQVTVGNVKTASELVDDALEDITHAIAKKVFGKSKGKGKE